jgi:hypothetical protein
MGETARERFNRSQAEKATQDAGQAAQTAAVPAAKRVTSDGLVGALLLKRKQALADRMSALGLLVTLSELPDAPGDLADLERVCAEAEGAKK